MIEISNESPTSLRTGSASTLSMMYNLTKCETIIRFMYIGTLIYRIDHCYIFFIDLELFISKGKIRLFIDIQLFVDQYNQTAIQSLNVSLNGN